MTDLPPDDAATADTFRNDRGNDPHTNPILTLLRNQEHTARTLGDAVRNAPLATAGISVTEDGLIIDRSISVIGDIWFNYLGSAENPGRFNAYVSGTSGRAVLRLTPPYTDTLDDTALYLEGPSDANPQGYVVLTSGGLATIDAEAELLLISRQDTVRVMGAVDAYLEAAGDAFVLADDTIVITAQGPALVTGSVVGFRSPRAGGGWSVDVNSVGDSFNAVADSGFKLETASGSHRVRSIGNDVGIDAPNRVYVGANLYANGNLGCAGTKPFIIDHPLHDDLSLVHAATESPVAAIEYPWPSPVTLDEHGEAVIELPDYFEALAADDYRAVWVQPIGKPFATGADLVVDGGTTVYGEPGRQVFVKVTARRGDAAGQFDVEQPRVTPPAEYPDEQQQDVLSEHTTESGAQS